MFVVVIYEATIAPTDYVALMEDQIKRLNMELVENKNTLDSTFPTQNLEELSWNCPGTLFPEDQLSQHWKVLCKLPREKSN